MAGGGVAEFIRLRIEIDIGGGDELVLRIAVESGVHAEQDGGWIIGVRSLGCGR